MYILKTRKDLQSNLSIKVSYSSYSMENYGNFTKGEWRCFLLSSCNIMRSNYVYSDDHYYWHS